MTLERNRTACFSGHRPKALCDYDEDGYRDARVALTDLIIKLAETKGIMNFVTGGAQGIDQLAFWAVEHAKQARPDLNLINVLVLPFPGFGSNWARTGTFSKAQLDQAVQRANIVRYTCAEDPGNDRRLAVKCLMDRNRDMIEMSGTLVAVYENDDWADPATKSGTADAMRKAKAQGLTVMRVPYAIQDGKLALDMDGVRTVPGSI